MVENITITIVVVYFTNNAGTLAVHMITTHSGTSDKGKIKMHVQGVATSITTRA